MSTVLLLSTADTDLLAARAAAGARYRIGNPTRVDVAEELPALARGRATSPSSGCSAASAPGRTGSRALQGVRRSRPCCSAARPCPTPS